MSINTGKSCIIMLKCGDAKKSNEKFVNNIPFVDSYKFLGIILDRNLSMLK